MRKRQGLNKADPALNNQIDKKLLTTIGILTALGLIAIADASAPMAIREYSDKFYFVKQQLVWAAVGWILMLFVAKIHYLKWEKYINVIFFLSVLLLVLVLIPGLGTKVGGARRWIIISGLSIQPSELVKLTLVMYLAKVTSKQMKLLAFLLPLFIVAFLIMLQPDLGTTIVILGIGMVQLFIGGIPMMKFLGLMFAGGVAGLLLIITSDYRRERLMTYFEQGSDPLGNSYHIRQILLALGSGGLVGVGLGESRQKYLFLPETATDSIFAVIAEEVGFVGASIIILLFVYLIYRMIIISLKAPDRFAQAWVIGILSWVAIQVFLNIGSMTALTPLTGIPLPFFSKGGSALATILVSMGVVLNISRYERK